MRDGSQGNAMAEIALALAMAFFSIMVLTMVSMGAGLRADGAAARESVALRPSAAPEREAGGAPVRARDLVIYYGGRFLDARLAPVDPARLGAAGRIVLAIDPALALTEAIGARMRIPRRDIVVTTLDARWLEILKENGR